MRRLKRGGDATGASEERHECLFLLSLDSLAFAFAHQNQSLAHHQSCCWFRCSRRISSSPFSRPKRRRIGEQEEEARRRRRKGSSSRWKRDEIERWKPGRQQQQRELRSRSAWLCRERRGDATGCS